MYLTESDFKIGLRDNQIIVKRLSDGGERAIPFANVDSISVFGMPQISTRLIRECLASDVPIGYYSEDGHYFGNLSSSTRIDPLRQKRQVLLTDNRKFCLAWSRNIVAAKIKNSLTLLDSLREVYDFSSDEVQGLNHSLSNLSSAESVEMLLGFEGNAAKSYFECLPKALRNDDFIFSGRSSRPPLDPFNSMLSYGYSILFRNIIGAIERRGLHPYFAYMHKLRFGHAALASDLIEEYRAPLIDKTVIDLVNEGEVSISDFYRNDAGAVYLEKEASKLLADRFSDAMTKNRRYLIDAGDGRSYGFQAMLDKKLSLLIDAIEHQDADLYRPYIWKLEK